MSKKLDEIAKRQMEEELYRVVADELKNDIIREGLMAKALVRSANKAPRYAGFFFSHAVGCRASRALS